MYKKTIEILTDVRDRDYHVEFKYGASKDIRGVRESMWHLEIYDLRVHCFDRFLCQYRDITRYLSDMNFRIFLKAAEDAVLDGKYV